MNYNELYAKAKTLGWTGRKGSVEKLKEFIESKTLINTQDTEPVEVHITEPVEVFFTNISTRNLMGVMPGKKLKASNDLASILRKQKNNFKEIK